MRTLQSFLLVGVVCTAAALLPGCSSSDPPATSGGAGASAGGATGGAGAGTAGAGTAGAGTAGGTALVGDITRGKTAYNSPTAAAPTGPGGACYTCHGVAGEGAGGPNITGATGTALGSGIGGWTPQQFHDAVRLAKRKDGTTLCPLMQAVPATGSPSASEQDIADLYAYLMSLNVATVNPGTYCPTM